MPADHRQTRAWRRLVAQVVDEEPVCWLRLPGCTYWSETGDHVICVDALPLRGQDPLVLDRNNVRGACHHCNRQRSTTPVELLGPLRARLEARFDIARAPALGWFD